MDLERSSVLEWDACVWESSGVRLVAAVEPIWGCAIIVAIPVEPNRGSWRLESDCF